MAEQAVRVAVGENGRLVLPAPFRQALGLTGAGHVVLTLEDDAVRVTSVRRRLMEARERLRRFVPARQGMVDAFLDERRAEAVEEEEAAAAGTSGASASGEGDAAPAARPAPDDLR